MLPTGTLVVKDPQASSWPKGIDYTTYLARIDPAEIITNSAYTISGPDVLLTKDTSSIVTGSLKTQVRLSGGTPGGFYTVTDSFVTSSGVHDDRSFQVFIENQ